MARQNSNYHRARRKDDELDYQNQISQRFRESDLAETQVLSSVEGVTRVTYDRTTISGNSFGILGNVYHNHVHVHHHYHGIPRPLSPEPWAQHITERTLTAMQRNDNEHADATSSRSGNLFSSAIIDAPGPSQSVTSTSDDISMSYRSIRQWLSSMDIDTSETESIVSSTAMDISPPSISRPQILPSINDDVSSEQSFVTCVERLGRTGLFCNSRQVMWLDTTVYEHQGYQALSYHWGSYLETEALLMGMTESGKTQIAHRYFQQIRCSYQTIVTYNQIGKDLYLKRVVALEGAPNPFNLEFDTVIFIFTGVVGEKLVQKISLNLSPGQSQRAVSRLDLAKACSVDANVRFKRRLGRERIFVSFFGVLGVLFLYLASARGLKDFGCLVNLRLALVYYYFVPSLYYNATSANSRFQSYFLGQELLIYALDDMHVS